MYVWRLLTCLCSIVLPCCCSLLCRGQHLGLEAPTALHGAASRLARQPFALMHIPAPPHAAAGQAGHNGALEWWDVDDMQLLSANGHFMAVELEWDPTGQTGGADDGSAVSTS